MFLVVDVGNTNIKSGLFEGKKLVDSWRIATHRTKTSDEYGIDFMSLFHMEGQSMKDVDGVIFSSVVPSINYTLEHMLRYFFHVDPLIVGPGIKTGLNIKYENAKELGSDRIVNAVAAYEIYGGPCITIDFGTATTFGVVSEEGAFVGGAICPGIKMSMEALVQNTSRLPKIELIRPESVINRNTISNMQSGIFYGFVGLVDYIVGKMKEEIGAEKIPVVATGGMSNIIAEESKTIDTIDPELTLQGLRILYERNQS